MENGEALRVVAWPMPGSSYQRWESASASNAKSYQQSSNSFSACSELIAAKSKCARGQVPALTEPFGCTQGNHRNGTSPCAFVLPHDQVRLRICRSWGGRIRGKV